MDSDNIEQCFEAGYFETGKMQEPFSANWITCDMSVDRHPIFEQCFKTSKSIKSAFGVG